MLSKVKFYDLGVQVLGGVGKGGGEGRDVQLPLLIEERKAYLVTEKTSRRPTALGSVEDTIMQNEDKAQFHCKWFEPEISWFDQNSPRSCPLSHDSSSVISVSDIMPRSHPGSHLHVKSRPVRTT